jgi:hypothetical protein
MLRACFIDDDAINKVVDAAAADDFSPHNFS